MKLFLPLLTVSLFATGLAFGQLPPGSTAPNWTMTDITGVSHTLYDYLDQDKVVFLDFSATWCGPCWNYHNSGALENLYNQYGPNGSNDVRVFMIEADASTNTACLYGPSGCVGGTQGNWVAGTPYPIIDDAAQNGAYAIAYFPTIYGVCADKTITEVGQQGTNGLWSFAQACPPLPPSASVLSVTDVPCNGASTGAISIAVNEGIGPYTYQWSNGATSQNLTNIPAGSYNVTVTGSNGGTASLGPILVSQPSTVVSLNLVNNTPAGCITGGSAEISVGGGTPGYFTQWSNGTVGTLITNAPPGTYSVTTTDLNGCTASLGNIVIAPPAIPAAAASAPTGLNCTNTSVTLSGNGSSTGPNFVYTWTTANGHIVSGANTLNNCVVDAAGTYQLQVFNSNNACTASASASVTQNTTQPNASAGPAGSIDCGTPSLNLSGSGSSGSNFTYLWTTTGGNIVSGATTLSPLVNAAGTYTLTVTNTTNGCTKSSSTTVSANIAAPNASASGGELTCLSNSVQLSGNSTTNGVTYSWSGPNGYNSTQQNPTVSAEGTYVLTVTNSANDCTASAVAEVLDNTTPPNASASGGTLNCLNSSVTLDGNSNTQNVSFEWSGPNGYNSTEQDPVVNVAGNYVLTVTGGNGCTQAATAIVGQNTTQPVANAGADGLLNCHASSVVLNGAGSSNGSQFSYEWTTDDGNIVSGETTLTPTVDASGNYTLTVTNSINGCTNVSETEVTETPPVTAAISAQTNIACFGNATGSATVEGGGGDGAFTYAWSNGASTASVSDLSAGTYTVTVTDGENCDASETVVISQPSSLVVVTSSTAQSIPGENNGSATANPLGGTGAYTFAWNNGETTSTINNLAPGNYTVTVTDENGCTKSQTITVNAFGCAVQAEMNGTGASCNGAADGTAAISLAGAAEPYNFTWSNGETTASISGLAAGDYFVTATDGNDCEVVASVIISEPAVLTANATSTGETAANAIDGTATANPTGGTEPFAYLWSNGETTASITGLASANYTVIVTDAHGCSVSQTVPVAPFACSAVANISSTNISCNGASDGTATVVFTGGLSPYTYEWSNEATSATVNGLVPGTYSVTVTDVVNCPAIAEVTIDEPTLLEAEITAQANADCGAANGMAEVTGLGGIPGYSFAWSNGATGASVSNLSPGNYTVSVTDANDCQATVEVEIKVNDSEPPVVAIQNLTVALNANGTAAITPSQVNNGSTDNCGIESMTLDVSDFDCSALGQHEVTLTVTDEAGNSSTGTATVTVVDNSAPAVQVQNIVVFLDENGLVSLTPEMLDNGSSDNCGNPALSIDISTFTCDNLGDNAVVLTATDAGGNSSSGTSIVTVKDNSAPTVSCPADMTVPYCNPVADYVITISDNCADNLAPTLVSGLPSGSTFPAGETEVTYQVSDGGGNTASCSFTVTVPAEMTVETSGTDVTCFGKNDGQVEAEVAGGASGYTFIWSNGATTPSIENLSGGNYSLTVTDGAGCSEVTSVSINEPAAIQTVADNIIHETGNEQNGAISVTVSGGVPGYSYEWTNANGEVISTEEDIEGLAAGTYTLEVVDANGCNAIHVFTVQSVSGTEDSDLQGRISLFPNPTTGIVTLEMEGISLNEVAVSVFDLTGKLAADYPKADLMTGRYEMDLSAQGAGVYLVKILVENQVVTKRLVVSR